MLPRADRRGVRAHGAGARLIRRAALPALLAAGLFALYAAAACRTVFFGDGGELVAAAWGFGVAHPPGYPLWTLLAKVTLGIPLGEPAWRVALLSAACAAASAALVATWVRRETDSTAAGLGAGLALGWMGSVWPSAIIPEVYTLHLLVTLALLDAARRLGEAPGDSTARRGLLMAAALTGVGLAHHPTIVLALPGAAILAWPGRRRVASVTTIAAAIALAIGIPVAAYASLLPRALANPEASWGTLRTMRDVISHASADLYRPYDLGWVGLLRLDAWGALGKALIVGSGIVAFALALYALARCACRQAAALGALVAASSLFALRYGVEDVDAYLVPAMGAIAILAGLAIAKLAKTTPMRWALAVFVVGSTILAIESRRSLHGVTAAADYGRDMLATIPERGILVADGDDTFVLAYVQRVLGERGDVEIYDRDGFVLKEILDGPGFGPGAGEPRESWRARRLGALVTASVLGPAPRPVLFMSRPEMPLPESIRIDAYGVLFRAAEAHAPATDDAGLWTGYHESEIAAQAHRVRSPFAEAVAASYGLMRAERALRRGDEKGAVAILDATIAAWGGNEAARNGAGAIFGRLGRYERAIREFEAAIALKPASQRAWANLATARELAGDRAGAGAARAQLRRLQGG